MEDKIISLFITDCREIERFMLERELKSHKSYFDKIYFVGECDKNIKNKFDNIIEINIKDINKFEYDYIKTNNIDLIENKEDFEYIIKLKNSFVLSKFPIESPINLKDFKIVERDVNSLYIKTYDNIYNFEKYKNKIVFIDEIEYDIKDLYHHENVLKVTKRILDNFDWKKYSALTHRVKQFKTLKTHIANNYNDEVSQAFLKMYEILETFDLFDLPDLRFKTFHFCEAPGQFIKSIEYYLKSKDKTLDWNAQSLQVTKDNKYNPLGDKYGLIKNNPERWTFGPDGSGDITKDSVIKSYKEICQDSVLITSDCGLSSITCWDMTYHDKIMAYINFCQILAILYNLPKKGNFIAKVFLPQTVNYIVSLNYILVNCFESFHVYKPYLNPVSSEVYLIGKNYSPLSNKTLNKLFKIKDNLNLEKGFLKIDNTFLKEYQKCFIKFILSHLDKVKSNIYFYENNIKFDQKKLKSIYNFNNSFWIKKFNFVKLKDDYNLEDIIKNT